MRRLRRWVVVIGFVGLLALGGGSGLAFAGDEGTPLPEVSGQSARRAPARTAPSSSGVDPQPYMQHRREVTLRPTRLEDGTLRFRAPGWIADVAPDGAVTFRSRRASWQRTRTQLAFDLTDATLRGRKGDPYAMEKLRFLEQTRSWRRMLRDRRQSRWQKAYFTGLKGRLGKLWTRRDLTAAQKRHLLYLLWEECLEPGSGPLRVLAQRARREIEGFIRRELPYGSPFGYTAEELGWMGRQRKGHSAFLPYGKLLPRARPPGAKGRPGGPAAVPPGAKGRPGAVPPSPAAGPSKGDDARRRAAPPPKPKPRPQSPPPRR